VTIAVQRNGSTVEAGSSPSRLLSRQIRSLTVKRYTELRNFEPKSKAYKVSDRGGMCATVPPIGIVTLRFDLSLGRPSNESLCSGSSRHLLCDTA
jgi:hypothetical protein